MSAIFPVFIPHLGCPHRCVFCDQHTIAGTAEFRIEDAEASLAAQLSRRPDGLGGEIAFFGGSFTGIDPTLMEALLSLAQGYVDRGKVGGIRFSTRPDYITPSILKRLAAYSVTTVELGIQSFSDRVLLASARGHTAAQSLAACRAVKEAGYDLIGQMMTALPASEPQDEVDTAHLLCQAGVDGARIYPTVVFPNSPLAAMRKSGAYLPPSLPSTVARCADVLEVFLAYRVPVIRIGLCSSEEVRNRGEGFHDAIGELVKSEVYRRRMALLIDSLPVLPASLTIRVARGHTSLAVGHKRANLLALSTKYETRISVREADGILPYEPKIE